MTGVELIALAGSTSLLAGWRLYLVTFVTGFAMRLGWIDLPDKLVALDVLANPWVLVLSGAAALFEFFADKIAFIDTLWDGINTAIRPLGGALLALAIVDPGDPVWQVTAFILGGGAAFLSHSGKAATRAMVNTSPEPVSNIVVSTGEDIAAVGLLALAIANPVAAALIALILVLASLWLILSARRLVRRVLNRS
ncbi:hypothetical protein GGQ97_002216 [Sphingomonas kaistensis]|uniref:DUF4126 domain-containing protein n=1 Tax=Sphingomonas kaistensis TaxID=298708 RepID=A0A7X5Y7W1_9SPHN|nr:DUF4126 domain-containing protein [Sphingomonas kaistensis]NJC06423.1 hypothetical protein [Sphingomonas kaistensis]